MSGYYNESDPYFDQEDRNTSGGGLRSTLEKVLEENKKLRERLEGQDRENSVSQAVKDAGLDPAIAALVPKDADAKEWVSKNAHLFAKSEASSEDGEDGEDKSAQQQLDDPAARARQVELANEQAALEAMNDAAEAGYAPEVANDLRQKMDKINSEEELMKFFESHGTEG